MSPLTVAGLIARLQTMPPDAVVEISGLYSSTAEIINENAVCLEIIDEPRRRKDDRKPAVIISTDLCTG